MAAKHTPGPWQTYDDFTSDGRRTIIANIDGEYIDGSPECTYDVVAICEDHFGDFLPNAAANARLIASAPALLEALTRALPYVETAEADEAYKPGEVAKVTAMIRAAIRQAEGGE